MLCNAALFYTVDGIRSSTTIFYQVVHTTSVTSSAQAESTDDSEDQTADSVIIAGVDELLETLNQLIVEPISQKSVYSQYGKTSRKSNYSILKTHNLYCPVLYL